MDAVKKITLLDTIHLVKESWAAVLPEPVYKCFRKGEFVSATDSKEQIDIDVLANVAIPDNLTAEEFEGVVEFDSQEETAGELTDSELLEAVTADRHPQLEEAEESEEDTAPQLSLKEQLQAVAFKTAMKLLGKLRVIYIWRWRIIKIRQHWAAIFKIVLDL
ncbi:UNVERIFIED_CONTAM: hypothetical protein FKN15_066709 [Acipenser sinensis]